MGIFLDTGFYLGLCHPKDKHAKDCERILRAMVRGDYGLIYSSNLIIIEVTTLAAVRTHSNLRVLNHLANLIWGSDKLATILHFDADKELETWELFKKINTGTNKPERLMSFVDVSSVILCRHHQIDKIASFDSHFDGFLERIS
ncbi:MAG: type II toxin-antitoxin system VapC family toxin [Promethearchaeota archaeon]